MCNHLTTKKQWTRVSSVFTAMEKKYLEFLIGQFFILCCVNGFGDTFFGNI